LQSAPFLRIGSRGSPLALVQARLVQKLLAEAHDVPLEWIEIQTFTTSGDKLTDARRVPAQLTLAPRPLV